MATSSLAVAALAGTAALATIELVARLIADRATRTDASTLALAILVSGGVALVVAGVASVAVEPTVALLAAGVTAVAVVAALFVRLGAAASRS